MTLVRIVVPCMLIATLVGAVPEAAAQGNRAPDSFTVIPITITGVSVQDGQLVANGQRLLWQITQVLGQLL
jgi:hypothetical protein